VTFGLRRALVSLLVLAALAAGGYAVLRQTEPAWWIRLWYPLRYEQVVSGNARLYHLDPALVAAVIYQESRFDASARSGAGAVGLMQLLPDTARGIALHTGGARFNPATDLLNPDLNVRYGCWYLRHLRVKYRQFRNGADLALAAYNAGQANVDRWIAGTAPGAVVRIRFAETRRYVDEVNRLEELYRKAYGQELGV
jgi:soluble lytic murein transglycosylase